MLKYKEWKRILLNGLNKVMKQIVEIYLTISSYFINNPFTKIEN